LHKNTYYARLQYIHACHVIPPHLTRRCHTSKPLTSHLDNVLHHIGIEENTKQKGGEKTRREKKKKHLPVKVYYHLPWIYGCSVVGLQSRIIMMMQLRIINTRLIRMRPRLCGGRYAPHGCHHRQLLLRCPLPTRENRKEKLVQGTV